MVEKLDFSGNY